MKLTSKIQNQISKQAQTLVLVRVMTGLLVRLCNVAISVISPIMEIELNRPVWPISTPLREWWYRVWFSPVNRWDVLWYASIVTQGYQAGTGTVQFHPLYPATAKLLWWLGFSPVAALQLSSWVASIAFLLIFFKLASLDISKSGGMQAVLLFLWSPFSFAIFVPYSESLFLLCAAAALLCARKQRWWLAGLMGALATLTRQQGLFLLLPLAWELFEVYERSFKSALKAFSLRFRREGHGHGYALFLIPLAYIGWILYRALATGDFSADFSDINSLVYSVLISPNASMVVPEQAFVAPWQAIAVAIRKLVVDPDQDIIANLVIGVYFMVLLVIAWPRMRISYKLYAVVITLVSWMYTTGDIHPYMGLVRHLTLAFPVFIGLRIRMQNIHKRRRVLMFGVFGLVLLSMFYTMHNWVP